jgi:hypothetical protein
MAGSAMAAPTVEIVKVKDKSLTASFSSAMDGSCGSGTAISSVDVHWDSSLIKSDGVTTMQSALLVAIQYINLCTGDNLNMSGFVTDVNGLVATDLASGHIGATVPVTTEPDPDTGEFKSGSVTVNLNFAATGSASTIRDRSHSRDGGVITISNFMVSARPAIATGSVSAVLPLAAGPTVVPMVNGPSLSAQIGKDANGSITIIRHHQ